jgi:hypothetical protein
MLSHLALAHGIELSPDSLPDWADRESKVTVTYVVRVMCTPLFPGYICRRS